MTMIVIKKSQLSKSVIYIYNIPKQLMKKNKFIQELAEQINRENYRLKQHCNKLQIKLTGIINIIQDYQDKIIQCLQQSGIENCNYSDLFLNFKIILDQLKLDQQGKKAANKQIENLRKQILFYQRHVSQQNQLTSKLQLQKQQLNQRFNRQKEQLLKNIRYQQDQFKQANAQKQKYKIQLEKIQQQKDRQVIDLRAEHRQNLHEIVTSHKQQMMLFKKDMEQQNWKMEMLLRKQIEVKNQENKKLILNIDKLQKNGSISPEDWKILQGFFLPYRNHTENTEKISKLRQQVSNLKIQVRRLTQNLTQSDIAKGQYKNQYENMKLLLDTTQKANSGHEQLIQSLTSELSQLKEKNVKMTQYYDQKWIQQFDKVRNNLEKKVQKKIDTLEKQYEGKKIEVQKIISDYQQQNKRFKKENQVYQKESINAKNQAILAIQKYEAQKKEKQQIQVQLNLRTAQFQIILENKLNAQRQFYSQQISELQNQIDDIMYQCKCSTDKLQAKINELQTEIKQIRYQQQLKKVQIAQQFNRKIADYETTLSEKQQLIKQFQKQQQELLQKAQRKYSLAKNLQVKRINDQNKAKIQKLEKQILQQASKFSNIIKDMEFQIKKLKLDKQEFKLELSAKDRIFNQLFHEKDLHIQELQAKINSVYLLQHELDQQKRNIKTITNQNQLQKQSLFNMMQTKEAQLYELSKELREVVLSKNKWDRDLKNVKAQFQAAFKQIKQQSNKVINFYKSRIRQLQHTIERRPMNIKDFQKIQSLTVQNRKLLDQISMKEAENLILVQIKEYYQSKTQQKQRQSKQIQPTDHKKIFVRKMKHKQNSILISLKQTPSQQKVLFENKEQLSQMKQYITRQLRQTQNKTTRGRMNSSMN